MPEGKGDVVSKNNSNDVSLDDITLCVSKNLYILCAMPLCELQSFVEQVVCKDKSAFHRCILTMTEARGGGL